ncbi:hypothetical protein HBH56_026670 [Parastagonospora nodorum]|uniref:Uncharacterized protein n=1 Tax=Phaeosphaeria nodorum (strain SN15 / ATCC MYA-4574 / FGSC 10173) TaxID=321614 RepID=A0A7U2F794_PHANO|nr:hypothetical protein HBH56_026670 [Parastagonospora nodorum]QRC98973.1 hypothetical protein JI435_412880 [Parastagonospora nodorum SN15]KAH3934244.1 hypothetical protein HBH54_055370 [Parastagonospora nodorum]KAH4054937.1 hypothetical protein HBH49_069300 [Parastagonospora nodorum]KAH4141559.1 hypothetical protein HBH45_061410 [Parastagonospora nodorum]
MSPSRSTPERKPRQLHLSTWQYTVVPREPARRRLQPTRFPSSRDRVEEKLDPALKPTAPKEPYSSLRANDLRYLHVTQ